MGGAQLLLYLFEDQPTSTNQGIRLAYVLPYRLPYRPLFIDPRRETPCPMRPPFPITFFSRWQCRAALFTVRVGDTSATTGSATLW